MQCNFQNILTKLKPCGSRKLPLLSVSAIRLLNLKLNNFCAESRELRALPLFVLNSVKRARFKKPAYFCVLEKLNKV